MGVKKNNPIFWSHPSYIGLRISTSYEMPNKRKLDQKISRSMAVMVKNNNIKLTIRVKMQRKVQ